MHRAFAGRDRGLALPTVFGLALVLLIMIGASMSVATTGTIRQDKDNDWNAALAAAYAGVSEYQSRLANDSTYVQYGNTSSKFTQPTGTTSTVVPPIVANPAFSTSGTTWATVPGSSDRAQFRYEVDTSNYQSKGTLRLRSTGKVGTSVRTVVADLKQSGFINYLYFTDYELQDPQFTGKTGCVNYLWGSTKRDGPGCGYIQFGRSDAASDADVFDGPVHSNDEFYICNAKFNRGIDSASTDTTNWIAASGCNPKGITVTKGDKIQIPATNTSDRTSTFTDQTRPGCLYTGPTKIRFYMSGSTAMMNVVSPFTKATNPNPGEKTGVTLAQCGDLTAMHTDAGTDVPAIDQNLIYVQNARPDGSVNSWATGTYPAGFQCRNIANVEGWSLGSVKFPIDNEQKPDYSTSTYPAYGCTKGDAYVSGVVGTAVTVSTENYIYVTGDITYNDANEDMLGLVGNNAVIVWNPVGTTTTTTTGCVRYNIFGQCIQYGPITSSTFGSLVSDGYNRTINAAILSVQHTFTVQNFTQIPRGTLTVNGSIAQKFRGPVGQGSNGYIKAYGYDARFVTTAPPKFLTPASTTYGVTQFAGVAPAYTANGTATDK
ncbi:MAG: hypothetical protein INR66_20940 [Gordonia polyisoprenivorans]|nr:hypothetical protein [Gordonia polyisoprenivorans]